MRRVADVKSGHFQAKRVMLYEVDNGVYVFYYNSLDDYGSLGDAWYESTAMADEACRELYGIDPEDWTIIGDPLEGCQHDWIAPVRVKGRNLGAPQWGQFERLENGEWVDVDTVSARLCDR